MSISPSQVQTFRAAVDGSLLSFIPKAIDELLAAHGPEYAEPFEEVLELLRRAFPERPWPQWPVSGVVDFCRMTLREEAKFQRTRAYTHGEGDFEKVADEVYRSEQVMGGYYLVGLLVTYFVWPHHFRLLRFFRNEFLSTGGDSVGRIAEWGCGHGLFALSCARTWPEADLLLYDVSPHSLDFASRMFAAAGLAARARQTEADILALAPADLPKVDRLVCAEMLEHVAEPRQVLDRVKAGLAPGGKVFLTAAVNAPQMDHLYLFRSTEEVLSMVADAGLAVDTSISVFHPAKAGQMEPPTVVAMVGRHA